MLVGSVAERVWRAGETLSSRLADLLFSLGMLGMLGMVYIVFGRLPCPLPDWAKEFGLDRSSVCSEIVLRTLRSRSRRAGVIGR